MLSSVAAAALAAPVAALGAETWTWPVEGEVLTDYRYGGDPFAAGQHRGVDIAAPVGETVRAATDGTVTFAGTAGDSGLTVAVRTADGRFDTAYLHLDALDVNEGERVEESAEIGVAGTTGSRSVEAPHVHFGVRLSGEDQAYRDPMRFLTTTGAPAPPLGTVPAPRVGPRPLLRPSPTRAPRRAPSGSRAPVPRLAPTPSGAPVAAPAPGPRPLSPPAPAPASPGRAPRAAPDARSAGFDLGWALACAGLAIAVGARIRPLASLLWPSTSRRRSTTPTRSRISGTPIPRSPPTSSRGTCASAGRTSSS